MSSEFRELEEVLRRHEAVLVNQAACRFRCACAAEQHLLHLAQTGAQYLHQLLVVSAAVYPSDVFMHTSYMSAMQPTAILLQRNLRFRHQKELSRKYFEAALEILVHYPHLKQALTQLEQKLDDVLRQMYQTELSLGGAD
jgi:hypothetical protein